METTTSKQKKRKLEETAESLETFTREQLINRVGQLEKHVDQLRNIISKNTQETNLSKKANKKQRPFDFKRFNTRHVALRIAYLGWDYQGFVVQEDTEKTVEHYLFDALLRSRLIESRETSNYHRCGRTDKGVSAFGQVISIDLRSNLLTGIGVKVREDGTADLRDGDKETEIRYAYILNKLLPPEIRVLAWTPVMESFSARFSCNQRTYKYYFPKGDLDTTLMLDASKKLIGKHDFRNFCKMDVNNGVVKYDRKIISTDIRILDSNENGYQMCEFTVVGQAFLWHQIRCIVAILFYIGQGKEDPRIIDDLLDIDKHPRKPQYTMASDLPLVLYDCQFDDLEWIYEVDVHNYNLCHLQQLWAQYSIKATTIKSMLDSLTRQNTVPLPTVEHDDVKAGIKEHVLMQSSWITEAKQPKIHQPLLSRQTCESLEEKIESVSKRKNRTLTNSVVSI
ncbi:tRNA pseudouridine(38/39) synthase [Patella vulgata]|uniref:tRNA pseudouridine(38/39) synthase n=1 Tax=Patella vulgata TaxID=6465 RepID=UPI0021802508|nr:tRNA pseudouridine(38/39) synthase [Patella vulgata]